MKIDELSKEKAQKELLKIYREFYAEEDINHEFFHHWIWEGFKGIFQLTNKELENKINENHRQHNKMFKEKVN